MSDVEVLHVQTLERIQETGRIGGRTLIPSCEKHGGTAEDSSSASLRRTGNFSTADIGISPL